MFGEFTLFKRIAEKVWQMNRSASGLVIVTTNLVWRIADDLPNSPNFLPAKLPCYMVCFFGEVLQLRIIITVTTYSENLFLCSHLMLSFKFNYQHTCTYT